jgi:hypothetical protein
MTHEPSHQPQRRPEDAPARRPGRVMVPHTPASLIEVGDGYVWFDGIPIGLLTPVGRQFARERGAE